MFYSYYLLHILLTMKFYFLLRRVYGLNLDLDASVWTNKLKRFGPVVFNEKENVTRPSPLEITSWVKINEDIFMSTLSPAERLGGIFIIFIRINSVSAVALQFSWNCIATDLLFRWFGGSHYKSFWHFSTSKLQCFTGIEYLLKWHKLSHKIEIEFSMLGKTRIVFITSTHKEWADMEMPYRNFSQRAVSATPDML